MKKIYVLIDLSDNSIEFYKNTLFDFAHELKKITVIDVSKLIKKKSKHKYLNKKYNLSIIQPKNFSEFIIKLMYDET